MLRAAALSSVGRNRTINEDTFTLLDLATGSSALDGRLRSQSAVLAVYDGHGQLTPGRSASHVAAHTVAERLATVPPGVTDEELSRRLAEAVTAANRDVFTINSAGGAHSGTTATVAAIAAGEIRFAHVGDSRAYLFAGGELRQITRDDTLLNEILAAGSLTPEEIASFPHKNVITRAIGLREVMEVPVTSLVLQAGDVLLLCTDGVYGMVDDPAIAAILATNRDPGAACDALIQAADAEGGHDNETAVVALFEPG